MRRVTHPTTGRVYTIGGCKLPKHAPVGLRLKSFMLPLPPASPASVDWSTKAMPVLEDAEGNLTIGDCVIAEDAHYIAVMTGNANTLFPYTDAMTIADYSAITGYNPSDPSTDQGTDPTVDLNYRVQKGYADGSKDAGWMLVDASNQAEVKYALSEFGNLKLWFGIPDSIANNPPNASGFVWDVSAGSVDQNNGHCFTGDTKVSLLDGRELSFEELAAGAAGSQFWVYSCDENGNVVPGHAHSARKTRADVELVEVTLDNGEIIRCTADHQFLMRDGTYQAAASLGTGSSLMPLYRRVNSSGYEEYFNPRTRGWHKTHMMVAFGATPPIYMGFDLHHWNFIKSNNDPSNLLPLSRREHRAIHRATADVLGEYARSERGRSKSADLMRALWADPVWRAKMHSAITERTSAGGRASWAKMSSDPDLLQKKRDVARANLALVRPRSEWTEEQKARHAAAASAGLRAAVSRRAPEERERLAVISRKNGARSKGPYPLSTEPNNHKVVSVRTCGRADVYDLTVDRYHNFALSSGVFVHNCIGSCGYNPSQIAAVGVTAQGVLVMTWGMLGLVTWAALAAWFVPAQGGGAAVRVTQDWVSKASGKTPAGLDAAAMIGAFNTYFGGNLVVPAPPQPAPTAPPTLAQAQAAISAAFANAPQNDSVMTPTTAASIANAALAPLWPTGAR